MNLNTNKICRLLASVMLIILSWGVAALAGVPTEVTLNRSIILTLKDPVERVTLANPGVADIVVISPKQIQINGTAIGKTSLLAWVRGSDKPIFYDLTVKGDQATIEDQIKEMAPKDNIAVQFAADSVVLTGKVERDQTKTKVEEIVRAYAPKVINHIVLGEPKQVLLQVKVAQVDRTALKSLGVRTIVQGSTENPDRDHLSVVGSAGSESGILGGAAGLLPFTQGVELGLTYFKGGIGAKLSALVTKNYAKILAEPNLLVKSQPPIKTGVKASGSSSGTSGASQSCSGDEGYACFLAGKKYPVTSLTGYYNGAPQYTTTFYDIGVKLVFHAEVQENGLINLKITPASVTAISGFADSGNPIIDAREVNTEVELGDGQSLVLAGMLQEDAVKSMSKIPLLGDIPILGALFRTTENDIKEKELVFFVTPKIVKPANTGDETKYVVKEGQKYELPGEKLPSGLDVNDVKVPENQERDLKWVPLAN